MKLRLDLGDGTSHLRSPDGLSFLLHGRIGLVKLPSILKFLVKEVVCLLDRLADHSF